jgi:3-methyladenine DNA glycosylase AlkD
VALAAAATLAGTRSATLLAAQLWGALDHQTREIGDTSLVKRLREQWQAPSRSTVDAAAWAAAWSAGTKLEPLDALELAATASTPVSTVEQP